jgi:predicted nucleic acid-binding Zn finger protein
MTDAVNSYSRIKLHIFVPSDRKIWTIVSRNNEYWLDLDLDYCTCKYYFFRTLSGKDRCIHLKSLAEALRLKEYDRIEFQDDEYVSFLTSLLKDILSWNYTLTR